MRPLIGIIGGLGEMGRWFTRFFQEQGYEVLIGEPGLTPSCPEVAARADVVMIAVPLHLTEAVIAELAPYLRPEALLTDITSLKEGPLRAMLQHFTGEVVGTHPLFGPGEPSLAGQNIVLCPGRGDQGLKWLQDLFTQAGALVEIIDAAVHDRLMSLVQGLTHFTLIALGATFRKLGADLPQLARFATPTFRAVYDQVCHLVDQNYPLYAYIQLLNTHNPTVHAAFAAAVEELRQVVLHQDANALMQVLEQNQRYFENRTHPSEQPESLPGEKCLI